MWVLRWPSLGRLLCLHVEAFFFLLTFISGKQTQQNEQIKWNRALTHIQPRPVVSFSHTCIHSHTQAQTHTCTHHMKSPAKFTQCLNVSKASVRPARCHPAACHTGGFLSFCFSTWIALIAVWWPPSWMPERSALPKVMLYNEGRSNAAHGFDEGLATVMEQIRAGQRWTWATVCVGGDLRFERRNNPRENLRTVGWGWGQQVPQVS